MAYISVNPYTGEVLKSYDNLSNKSLLIKLEDSNNCYSDWSKRSLINRIKLVDNLVKVLTKYREENAQCISVEMGKPITQARAEIDKCIYLCSYAVENAQRILAPRQIVSSAKESYIVCEPQGIVYGVMPWNFPFWQVFRYLIPNVLLGNTVLLKHASNVPQCAEAIEKALQKAGFPYGVFINLFIDYEQSEKVINCSSVIGITLTGSEYAGRKIAEIAGRNLKKTVMELGGSDPYIVLEDADLEVAVKTGVFARIQNAGQSCIAAKRFIISESIWDVFIDRFVKGFESLKTGDPLKEDTEMGPMANLQVLNDVERQVEDAVNKGAVIHTGGFRSNSKSLFYSPTVITGVRPDMSVYSEEVFGPVALMIRFSKDEEAIQIANNTDYGLGASLWTKDIDKARRLAPEISAGIVTINGLVKSDPPLPFGGIKTSGYGRELSDFGFLEFANIKTISIA